MQADFLKWRKQFLEHVDGAGEADPFPNTFTAEKRTETRKKLSTEFVTLRGTVCVCVCVLRMCIC